MRMAPGDPEETEATSQFLAREFESWMTARELVSSPAAVDLVLLRRGHSADGRFNFWTPALVEDVLMWLPSQSTLSASEAPLALDTVRSFVRFLAETGLLDPRGGSLEENLVAVEAVSTQFEQALSDPRRHDGIETAADHSVPPEQESDLRESELEPEGDDLDPEDLDLTEVLQDLFQQASSEQPELGAHQHEREPPMPPVRLPAEDDLAAQAERSTLLARMQTLYRWLQEQPRELTETGELLPTDSRELSERIGLPTPGHGDETPSEKLDTLIEWATAAELVQRVEDRLLPVEDSAELLDQPLQLWFHTYQAFFGLNVFPALSHQDRGGFESVLDIRLDGAIEDLLSTLYGLGCPTPFSWVRLPYVLQITDDEMRAAAESDLEYLTGLLVELGAVHSEHGVPDPMFGNDLADPEGVFAGLEPDVLRQLQDEVAGSCRLVALTPIGKWAHRLRLLEAGQEAPLIGELADTSTAGLLSVLCDHYDPASAETEIEHWLTHNQADLDDLLEAVRATPFRTRAAAITHLLVGLPKRGDDVSERMLVDRELAPYALVVAANMLADSDDESDGLDEDLDDDDPRVSPLTMVESLLQLLETVGPDAFSETLRFEIGDGLPHLAATLSTSKHPDANGISRLRQLVSELNP